MQQTTEMKICFKEMGKKIISGEIIMYIAIMELLKMDVIFYKKIKVTQAQNKFLCFLRIQT